MNFKKITIEDKAIFDDFFRRFPPNISELTFTNLFCWRLAQDFEWAIFNDHLLISWMDAKRTFYPPIGKEPESVIRTVFDEKPDAVFARVEKNLAEKFAGFRIAEEREQFDYLHELKDLIELPGRKFAAKRNFIKRAQALNPKVFHCSDEMAGRCLQLQEKWCNLNNSKCNPALYQENLAIREFFQQRKNLSAHGIIILIGDEVSAFAIGEKLNSTTYVDHFEKADTKYPGIYQLLLWEFAKSIPPEFRYMNREQDVGVCGLRKAKLSYHPVRLIEKYRIEKQL